MKNVLLFALLFSSVLLGQMSPQWWFFGPSTTGLKSNNIIDIEVDRFNRKWILTDSGLVKVEVATWTSYNRVINGCDMGSGKVMSVDYNGNVWIGGFIGSTMGVVMFNGTTAISYNSSNSPLPSNVIHSINFDNNNKAYILCGSPSPSSPLYLTTFDGTTWKNYPGHFYYDDVGEIAAFDNEGYLWMAEVNNLWKFKDSTYTLVQAGSFGSYLTDLKFDSFGNLWLAKGWGGWSTVLKYSNGVSTTYPYRTISMTNSDDAFWLGGYNVNGALAVRYQNGVFTQYPFSLLGFPSGNMINSIKSDHRGNKWMAIENNGIAVFRETGIEFYPVELSSFSAAINKEYVTLIWQTSTETNNRGFEIERSLDGKIYSSIGYVEGNGTTTNICNYTYTDNLTDQNISGEVYYRLKQIDNDGTFEYTKIVTVNKNEVPSEFLLAQNYPNPFNPSTVINYQLPSEGNVTLKIYNSLGEEVAQLVNEFKQAGKYTVEFNASEIPSGIYYYQLNSDNGFASTKKMVVVK